jgi:hypothetical protein
LAPISGRKQAALASVTCSGLDLLIGRGVSIERSTRGVGVQADTLAGYFVDDLTSRKASLLESVRTSSWTPRRVAWVSPKLTARSGVTMRVMRLSRRWWAARRRLWTYPDTTLYSPSPKELHTVWQLLGRVGGSEGAVVRREHARPRERAAAGRGPGSRRGYLEAA